MHHGTEALSDLACSVALKAGACIDNSVVRASDQQQGGSSDMAVGSANDDYPFAAKCLDHRVEPVQCGRLLCALERTATDAEHDDTQATETDCSMGV